MGSVKEAGDMIEESSKENCIREESARCRQKCGG